MHYDYVPMPQRKPLRWPNGARIAVILTINLEYWDLTVDTPNTFYAGGPQLLPDPLPGNVADWPNYSWREYGQRVGIWRMMDLFDKFNLRASCTTNAKTCLERRPIIDAAKERGWELVAHNYVQTELLTNYTFDRDKEKEIIGRTLDVYSKVVGKPAKGWLSSSMRCTTNTPEILTEYGLIFQADWLNDDQPFVVHTAKGPLVQIPYTNECNDFATFFRRGMTTRESFDVFKTQFDVLYHEGAKTGMLMNVGLHPHVIGQPFRIPALTDFLSYIKTFDDVWVATREEIAEWYLQHHKEHIA